MMVNVLVFPEYYFTEEDIEWIKNKDSIFLFDKDDYINYVEYFMIFNEINTQHLNSKYDKCLIKYKKLEEINISNLKNIDLLLLGTSYIISQQNSLHQFKAQINLFYSGNYIDNLYKIIPAFNETIRTDIGDPEDRERNRISKNNTSHAKKCQYAICSEGFVLSNPYTWENAAQRIDFLKTHWGEKSFTDDVISVMKINAFVGTYTDFKSSGQLLNNELKPNKMLFSCCTSRIIDFIAAAQLLYYGANFSTIFCNVVHNKYGKGCSCFVGSKVYTESEGVYGNVFPGYMIAGTSIKRTECKEINTDNIINNTNIGTLEEFEEALVIIDVHKDLMVDTSPKESISPEKIMYIGYYPLVFGISGKDFFDKLLSNLKIDCEIRDSKNVIEYIIKFFEKKEIRELFSNNKIPYWAIKRCENFNFREYRELSFKELFENNKCDFNKIKKNVFLPYCLSDFIFITE